MASSSPREQAMRAFSDHPTKQAIFLATLHFLSRLRSSLARRRDFTVSATFPPTHPTRNAFVFLEFHKIWYTGVQYLPSRVDRDSRRLAIQLRRAAFLVDRATGETQHLVGFCSRQVDSAWPRTHVGHFMQGIAQLRRLMVAGVDRIA